MSIEAIPLTPIPESLDASATMLDALHRMVVLGTNHLPVLHQGQWVGLAGVNMILRAILPIASDEGLGLTDLAFAGDACQLLKNHVRALASMPVSKALRPDVEVLRQTTPLLEAALLLSRHDFPLPVLDAAGRLQGMLSRRAFLAHLMQKGGVA